MKMTQIRDLELNEYLHSQTRNIPSENISTKFFTIFLGKYYQNKKKLKLTFKLNVYAI